MAVRIGSARIDENGHAMGGKPGDQTGRELSTQNWYLHSKGWRVFRPISPQVAEKSAWAMQEACDNPCIGYDQGDRLTLYYTARDVGFDPAEVRTKCETDCSALVRVCEAYAGIMLPNFTTHNEAAALLASGAFVELKGAKYTDGSAYLKRGDVLVTAKPGHTVIVLTDGAKAENAPAPLKLGDRILRNGCEGADVKAMQEALIELGYNCGRWGADGDFGDATEEAVKKFQRENALVPDGEFGPASLEVLNFRLAELATGKPHHVQIVGGSYYVRSAPDTSGKVLGVVSDGTLLPYGGETSPDGWLLVDYHNANGWVSGKGGRLVE